MRKNIAFFSFFLLLVSVSLVGAIGLSPPSFKIDYIAGETVELEFFIKNNAGKDQLVDIFLQGALTEYANVSDTRITIPKDSFAPVTVTLSYPESPEELTPGKQNLLLYVHEKAPPGAVGITATTGVIGKMVIFVPYPGRYAEIKSFSASGVNAGQNVPVEFSIINRGREELKNTKAEITLYDSDDELLQTIVYENINILTETIYSEKFFFNTSSLSANSYKGKLTYYYDDKTISKERTFLLGYFNVSLEDYPKTVEQKGIVLFTFDIRSLWKGKIYVSGEVKVDGIQGAKTSQEFISDFGLVKMTSYIDTDRLELGPQTGSIVVSIKRDETGGSDPLVQTFPISFELVELTTPEEESEKQLGLDTISLLLIFMAILLLAALGVLGFMLLKKKKPKAKRSKE